MGINPKVLVLSFIFIFSFHFILAQTGARFYSIRLAGFQIGELTINTFQQDTLTCYTLHSEVNFWLFFRIHIEHAVKAVFYKDLLLSSTTITHSSKGDFQSKTLWKDDHYEVKVKGYKYLKDTVINKPIHFNIIKLYLEKPSHGQEIFADNYGILTKAEKTDKNDELVVSVLGNENTYHYRNNHLIRADMFNPIKNYQIKLKSEK